MLSPTACGKEGGRGVRRRYDERSQETQSQHPKCSQLKIPRSHHRACRISKPIPAKALMQKASIGSGGISCSPGSRAHNSHVTKQRHETEIHVALLVTVKERRARVRRDKVDLRVAICLYHHHVLVQSR